MSKTLARLPYSGRLCKFSFVFFAHSNWCHKVQSSSITVFFENSAFFFDPMQKWGRNALFCSALPDPDLHHADELMTRGFRKVSSRYLPFPPLSEQGITHLAQSVNRQSPCQIRRGTTSSVTGQAPVGQTAEHCLPTSGCPVHSVCYCPKDMPSFAANGPGALRDIPAIRAL